MRGVSSEGRITRREFGGESLAVREVHTQAFGRPAEADLVDAMRNNAVLSLVCVEDFELVGHVLFTAVTLDDSSGHLNGAALGPIGVLPAHQRSGIGRALICDGIAE